MSRLKNLYHTTCRNRILEEKTTGKSVKLQMWTRKMERERYCELIECNMVICFFSWSLIQNHFPHKMHKRRIDLFVCFFSSSFTQNNIIFSTKCTGAGGVLTWSMRQRTNNASDVSLPSPGYVARRGAPGPPMATCPHCLRNILLAAHIAKNH